MKKLLFLAATVLMMGACGNKTASGNDKDSMALSADSMETAVSEETGVDTLKTDTVSFTKEQGIFKFGLMAEYPVAGGDSVVTAVRAFINDFLGGAYNGPLANGKAMVKKNGEIMWGNFLEQCGDADTEEANELFQYKMVTKLYETPVFVTFMASVTQYTGGIHGIGYDAGHTFSKSNGKEFGYAMMKKLQTPAFKRLVKEGLREYFSKESDGEGMSDESLKDELVSYDGSLDDLPLPDTEPYMTAQGVTFIYQPYEISYYAAGKPEFTSPYNVVKPYLTAEAIALFLKQ